MSAAWYTRPSPLTRLDLRDLTFEMRETHTEPRDMLDDVSVTADPAQRMRDSHRGPDDDFFCLRFEVWYPSFDCAVRTRFRTCASCENCDQGRFNMKRHGTALRITRVPLCEA